MTLKQESKLIQAFISEAQSGKSSAFEQLYKTHVSRIYSLGLKVFEHNKQAAEELTRRVFVNAFGQISAIPENTTFILWLKKLAFEEIKNGNIDKIIELHETGIVEKAIFSLPVEERTIFILHDVDKLPIEEIAEVTKDSTGDTTVKLERARKSIMDKLNVKRLEDLQYKVSFLPQKTEPRQEFWNVIFNEISKPENSEEKDENKRSIGDKLIGLFRKKT